MALRRHTHFTAAAPQKKQPAPDCLLQNRKIVAKTKRFRKCRLLLSHPKAACTNKNPAAGATGLNKEASRTLGTDFFQWAADSRP